MTCLGLVRERRHEGRCRTAQRVPLAERDAEVDDRPQLVEGLDALGQDPAVQATHELTEHLGQGPACGVAVDAGDQRAVQLDDLRTDREQRLQPRVACADVVERHDRARRPRAVEQREHGPGVVGHGPLGQLDDEPVQRRDALDDLDDLVAGDQPGIQVDRQERVGRQRSQLRDALPQHAHLQHGTHAEPVSGGEPPVRRLLGAGEPRQHLVADDDAAGQVHDGLVHEAVQAGFVDDRAHRRIERRARPGGCTGRRRDGCAPGVRSRMLRRP